MEKNDLVVYAVLVLAFGFCVGLLIGDSYGFNKGYKEGFDKALPLTYASVYKK